MQEHFSHHQGLAQPSFHPLVSVSIRVHFNQSATLISNLSWCITHNQTSHLAKGHREHVGNKHTGSKHILTSLQRNKVMWHKVMSLASDQGQLSLLCLSAFQNSEFRNGKDGMRRRGGRDHMVRDVSGCGGDGRFPPPPGTAASLWLAISVVFNLRDKGVSQHNL